ncbi:hypothetical protein WISP_84581 [Willisornis vidua]|uniref:Uncharacterized protein n=1 Tax=Willisornis vidua TaxID=1566151 RepID=A0ABQ9D9D7_9PASS|nr:hypothetical protein WISP_84581 [Willisornis vidua]
MGGKLCVPAVVQTQVDKVCGQPRQQEGNLSVGHVVPVKEVAAAQTFVMAHTSLNNKRREFINYMKRSRTFYTSVAERLCDGDLVMRDSSTCWNGEDVVERFWGAQAAATALENSLHSYGNGVELLKFFQIWSLDCAEITVKIAINSPKEKPCGTGRIDVREGSSLDGSQSMSFWRHSKCNSSDRFFMQKFRATGDKIPAFISSQGTELPVPVLAKSPDPNQTQTSIPESGSEVLSLQRRCKANAVSPQKMSKQHKENDGVTGSDVCDSRFRGA